MFKKVLIANRGEIALRIHRACKEMGIQTVAIHSTADSNAMHVRMADESVCIGPPPAAQSYLSMPEHHRRLRDHRRRGDPSRLRLPLRERHLRADRRGPRPDLHRPDRRAHPPDGRQDHRQGDDEERSACPACPAPTAASPTLDEARRVAAEIGYPVIVKATAGGGGRGMKLAKGPDDIETAFQTARAEAKAAFGNDEVYLEKYLTTPRHIEIQVFGDGKGGAVHLGERDCSLQRRHQKVLEEAPSPVIDAKTRARIGKICAEAVAKIDYAGAGTIEFLYERRRVLLHRDEHPPAGRASGDRGDLRRRPRPGADPRRRRPADVLHPGRARPHRPRHRVPDQRREAAELPALARQDPHLLRARRARRAHGQRDLRRLHDPALLRQPDRQADRPRPHPRRSRSPACAARSPS